MGAQSVWALIAVSVVLVAFRLTWRFARYPVTAVHEFGHLITAVALGGRAGRVRLRADTSGLTTWRITRRGQKRAGVIALAGPALPPLVGAGCALAYVTDRAPLGVIGLAVGVGVMAAVVRNLWGVVVCVALAGICWLAWRHGRVAAQALMVVTATILCLGGTRAIGEEMTSSPLDGTRDTKVAANAFWLPPQVWAVGLLVWALTWTGWAMWRLALAP